MEGTGQQKPSAEFNNHLVFLEKPLEKINYDTLIQNALRSVVRKTLQQVFENGLPESNHFYITFKTTRKDVQIPDSLLKEHPDELTIVMQHQFWDLEVSEDYFFITLSFNGKRERLKISFSSLVSFMDPSVKFGLQFSPEEPSDSAEVKTFKAKDEKGKKNNILTLDAFRNKKNE